MAYANAHVKITLFGTSCNGAEEWSTGFRMGSEDVGSGNFAIGTGFVEALLPLWETFFTASANQIYQSFKTSGIKAAIILADGSTDIGNVTTIPYASPIIGGKPTNGFPPQVAMVAQLAAASPIGLGAKGRMYLPGVAQSVQESGHVDTSFAQTLANNLRTFLDGAENAVNSPGYVMNASKGRPGVPFTAPVNRRVTSIRVGTVYDTQRRRRNGLQETYMSAAMAA